MTNQPSQNLDESIERVEQMLEGAEELDTEKLKLGLGIRLALGMARELRDKVPLGSETSDLVVEWTERFGQAAADAAVGLAREFLLRPGELRNAMAVRMPELIKQSGIGAEAPEDDFDSDPSATDGEEDPEAH